MITLDVLPPPPSTIVCGKDIPPFLAQLPDNATSSFIPPVGWTHPTLPNGTPPDGFPDPPVGVHTLEFTTMYLDENGVQQEGVATVVIEVLAAVVCPDSPLTEGDIAVATADLSFDTLTVTQTGGPTNQGSVNGLQWASAELVAGNYEYEMESCIETTVNGSPDGCACALSVIGDPIQVTNNTPGNIDTHLYNTRQSFNADGSKFVVGGRVYDVASPTTPGPTVPFTTEITWSETDPDLIYGIKGGLVEFKSWRLSTNTETLIYTSPTPGIRIGGGEGNVACDNRVTFSHNSGGDIILTTVDFSTGTGVVVATLAINATTYDKAHTSMDGQFVVVGTDDGLDIYDFNLNLIHAIPVATYGGHGDVLFHSDGNQYWLSNDSPDATAINLATGSAQSITVGATGHWSANLSKTKPGFALDVSNKSGGDVNLVQFNPDFSPQFVLGFPHESTIGGLQYNSQPRADISPPDANGDQWILYNSDMGGNTPQVYLRKIDNSACSDGSEPVVGTECKTTTCQFTVTESGDVCLCLEYTLTDGVLTFTNPNPFPASPGATVGTLGNVEVPANGSATTTDFTFTNGQLCYITNCPTTPDCVNRISSLLSRRTGFGQNTTGGTVLTEVTDLDDLAGYLTDAVPRWIYFNPSLNGQTWNAPLSTTGSNVFRVAANKTLDGRDALVTLQLGTPNAVTSYSSVPGYNPVRLVFEDGNVIFHNVIIQGDLAPGVVEDPSVVLNGTSDVEIWGGSNYFFDQVTVTRVSDEALSVFHNNGGTPDLITITNTLFDYNKNDSIVGNPHPTTGSGTTGPLHQTGRITQSNNLSRDAVEGRAPGIYYNMYAHVYNNWTDYLRQGIQVWDNAEVRSEYNHLEPTCVGGVGGSLRVGGLHLYNGSTATRPLLGVPGVLNDTGSWVYPCPGGSSDSNFNATLSQLATLPYGYMPITDESLLLDSLNANAGARQPTGIDFCE